MEILGRFDGRNGQITIAQERKTGGRLYVEEASSKVTFSPRWVGWSRLCAFYGAGA
jgi:hypothetical protein